MKSIALLIFTFLSVNTFSQIKVKADLLHPFQEGFAIVSYNRQDAIINDKGEFLVPYNTYSLDDFNQGSLEPQHGFINGGCVVLDQKTGRMGMINTKGKLVVPAEYILVEPFDKEGWAHVMDLEKEDMMVHISGKKMPVNVAFLVRVRAGLTSGDGSLTDLFNGSATRDRALSGVRYVGKFVDGISPGVNEKGSWSYYDRQGKQAFAGDFATAEMFSDGLACVSALNEFKEQKFGFIDKKGKVVIPYQFSRQPGNFRNGFAYVAPANTSEFDFAFINKTGEVMLKQKKVKFIGNKNNPGFVDGYLRMQANSGEILIYDSTGALVKLNNMPRNISLFQMVRRNSEPFEFKNGLLMFSYNVNNKQGVAITDLNASKTAAAEVVSLGAYDPVSGLALGTRSADGQEVYLNRDGKVAIEPAAKSNW